MVLRSLFVSVVLVLTAGGAAALDNDILRLVETCMKQTRAPGSYIVTQVEPVPVVGVADGGSQAGMRNVNDCLQDRYHVQYGSGLVLTDGDQRKLSPAQCKKRRDSQKALGAILSVGVATAIGWPPAGAAIWGGVAIASTGNREYNACLRNAGVSYYWKGGVGGYACSRGGSVMYGGSGYC